jgi:hypothetical protein
MAMELQLDVHVHADRLMLDGTQYFELLPGRYDGKHWVPGARFIHEYTFSLIEGIFEKHLPDYDHYTFIEVLRPQWEPILRDLASLRTALEHENVNVTLPYGRTLNVQPTFEETVETNQHALAVFLIDLETWLHQTLAVHEVVSILGL